MKIPRVSFRLSAVLAGLSLAAVAAALPSSRAMAQGGAPNAQNIAVIDIGKVLMSCDKFKSEMASFKAEVIAAQKELQQAQRDLQQLQNQRNGFAPDTPDYKRLDDQITKGSADFQYRNTVKKKEFTEREGKLMYSAYREVHDAIKQFSLRYNIAVVVQYDSSEVSPSNPQSIMSAARSVVYVNQGLDITQDIINILNHRATTGPSPIGVSNPGSERR